ncbi:MAG: inositol monophosphatase [Deltaproteobacteria bacterium]|nr:inositol monophosphatase [Candidatus Zymogenaceae bacterium]
MTDTDHILETAVYAARTAGDLLVSRMKDGRPVGISGKGVLDYVTQADRDSEDTIREIVLSRHPDDSFLAEEGGLLAGRRDALWVVDPLDGTINYMSSLPIFSVSVGFMLDGVVEVGVVLDPMRGELFRAVRGKGAFCNDRPIRVNDVSDLSRSVVITGFPHQVREHLEPYLAGFAEIFKITAGIRRLGSAALDFCYTAAGRADGFWEPKLSIWDMAAGSLIASEAGGIVTDFAGTSNYTQSGSIIAAPPKIHPILLEIVQRTFLIEES